MPPADADEIRELIRNSQTNSTAIQRLGFELETHLKDSLKTTSDFYKFVMDPRDGLVVRATAIERRMLDAENHLTLARMEGAKVAPLVDRVEEIEESRASLNDLVTGVPFVEQRVAAIEEAREKEVSERRELRKWGLRDVLVPLIMSLVAGAIGAWLQRANG